MNLSALLMAQLADSAYANLTSEVQASLEARLGN